MCVCVCVCVCVFVCVGGGGERERKRVVCMCMFVRVCVSAYVCMRTIHAHAQVCVSIIITTDMFASGTHPSAWLRPKGPSKLLCSA